MPAPAAEPAGPRPARRLQPHLLAAIVVSLEAAALLGFGIWLAYELAVATPSNRDVAIMSTVFFLVIGVGVAGIAVAAWQDRNWVYGPTVFLQLLALPVAYNMLTGGFVVGAVLVGAAAATSLLVLLSPAGRTAFGR